ncbi:MAG TPA: sigma-70 family RNA polymerase sigma factor [Candidatus Angelobacter sp.]|nr:sigma-70 family RNA polymerase sigma factor [Candidatus Angelobacter sp.]
MTISTTAIPLLVREQIAHPIVETSTGQTVVPAPDEEARRLAADVGRGDETAFRTLYETYHPRLFRFALVLSRGDEFLAQDVVQAAFLAAAKKLRRAESEEHLWNWLARVARQQLARKWRKHQRDLAFISVDSLSEEFPAAEPDSVLEEILDAALRAIEPEDRALIEIFYFERRSHKEIAGQLHTTPKAISSRLERAREKLRSLIKRKLPHET